MDADVRAADKRNACRDFHRAAREQRPYRELFAAVGLQDTAARDHQAHEHRRHAQHRQMPRRRRGLLRPRGVEQVQDRSRHDGKPHARREREQRRRAQSRGGAPPGARPILPAERGAHRGDETDAHGVDKRRRQGKERQREGILAVKAVCDLHAQPETALQHAHRHGLIEQRHKAHARRAERDGDADLQQPPQDEAPPVGDVRARVAAPAAQRPDRQRQQREKRTGRHTENRPAAAVSGGACIRCVSTHASERPTMSLLDDSMIWLTAVGSIRPCPCV